MPSANSPLSPRLESLAIPSQARRRPPLHARQTSSGTAANLRLPSLPRFHPANFASSQNSSTAATPVTGPNSPQPPVSPRTHQRQYSEVQRQMYLYQQQLMANARNQARGVTAKPTSPRLIPLESPGPVTPMDLEGAADGYLTAGVNTNDAASHVDKLIREEALRRGEISPGRTTSVGGR
ncbi:hypothetical protein BU26DRAFT_562808 [Trematosphaeria pertusa]|uniref:Uncharacterized protein n=1 Tax=Trematosphaeria pertusa TaxID=390896 RepID=A0A6A6IK83_9PLEO|nr:uncharacterized protein BU26DRAFT_562808 [Trematosphaeria pertusa]KAF2250841.1 hypothetical protein BU26DRAFT_562808 [Trematosphaeria pertusa]